MPYRPWLRAAPDPDAVSRGHGVRHGVVFAAALSLLVQLPGFALAFAPAWHRFGHMPHAAAGPAAACGLVAAALVLLPWRGPRMVAVAAFATPAIALAPVPPPAVLPVAIAAGLAVSGGATAWAWSTLAGLGVTGVVWIAAGDAATGGVRVLVATVVLCIVAGVVTGATARRARFREAARDAATRRRSAAEEERLRIARELHDVLAHSLSQISVQAGVGLHLFDDDPERARESLRSIRDASTVALDEVRGVLGMLREPGPQPAPRGPGPTLRAIPALLGEARRAGTRLSVTGNVATGTDDADGMVPAAVQSAAYRIVQEALTNVRRHAPDARVEVEVRASADAIDIRVENGPGPAHPGSDGRPDEPAGKGILGMRERARALGGRLEAGPTPAHGFLVRSRLPLVVGRRTP